MIIRGCRLDVLQLEPLEQLATVDARVRPLDPVGKGLLLLVRDTRLGYCLLFIHCWSWQDIHVAINDDGLVLFQLFEAFASLCPLASLWSLRHRLIGGTLVC